MKYITAILIVFSFVKAGECERLISKFHAPNPEYKTMRQLKRWVDSNIPNSPEKSKLLECLIEKAADNPNREMIAAE